ncbi:hypothetical protein [Natrialba taiwanensis]|uniref:hypothetical protein n=1 Tax=Natrialba taiwanensis TaxID=160846 RepID=UPI001267CC69|nr:hypothetical protein [Natrialba taiwanensis]
MARSDSTVEVDESLTESGGIGLDLFAEETPQTARYRFLLHFGAYVVLLLLVIWPIFSMANRLEPYVLGLPFNMFWNILVLVLVLINSALLYRFDEGKLQGGS